MANFSINNIKKNITGKALKDVLLVAGAVALVEALPSVIQAVGGYKADGTPNINASGPAFDIATGALGIGVALGYDRKDIAGAIGVQKIVKMAYVHLNAPVTKIGGTPLFLPSSSNSVISKSQINSGVGDSVPVTLPDGTTKYINVVSPMADNVDQIVRRMNDYSNTPLGDYSNSPLNDYSDSPLGDYTNNPLNDDYVNQPLPESILNPTTVNTKMDLADAMEYTMSDMSSFNAFSKNISRGRFN